MQSLMPLDEFNRGPEVIDTALRDATAHEKIFDYSLLHSKDGVSSTT
jgi:hypothetical protein